MLSKVSEKKMRFVRFVLAAGWLVLIASLFYDPVSIVFTQAENLASPFRIHPEKKVFVQGVELQTSAYQMGTRIFWTMIIPVAPIAIMLLGHEAWRRICPLSFFSQLPRYANKNYYRKNFNRKSGKIEAKLNLVAKDSWLQKNHWYLQFWLLFLALCVRILFVNSDRIALAIFLLFIIVSAITIGYVFGGKTWCNYICPIGIVQKIYTEPGGVLESKAHIEKLPISQSMCRDSTISGDKSICVGCTSDCPDIDLEAAYWRGIESQPRRFVYYAFLGLVAGFYGYYYLYSGNWGYYYSGAWTHEADQIGSIFKPGLYLFGQSITFIPKIVAVPFVLGVFVFLSYHLGSLIENAYRLFRIKINKPLHNKDLLNHVFSVYAFVTINVFYVFGGRPNIKLMSEESEEVIGLLIVIISSLWLDNALSRSYRGYQRESIANRLLEQLKKLSLNFSELLDGNSLDNLNYDEIYILGKTLPGITRTQKLDVYKNILHDSLNNGSCNSSDSLSLMSDIRIGMGITDEEHNITLQELGIEDVDLFDSEKFMSHETRLRENNYKEELSNLLNEAVEKNINVQEYLQEHDKQLDRLKAVYNIEENTHSTILSELLGDNHLHVDKASVSMDKLLTLSAQIYTLLQQRKYNSGYLADYIDIIFKAINLHRQRYVKHIFGLIETLGSCQETEIIAHNLYLLLGNDIDTILSEEDWQQRLDISIYNILTGISSIDRNLKQAESALPIALQRHSYTSIVARAPEIKLLLISLVENDDIIISIYALLSLSILDEQEAKNQATLIKDKFESKHWLAREVIQYLLGNSKQDQFDKENLNVSISLPNGEKKSITFSKPIVSFGRNPSNDITLIGPNIEPFHGFIKKVDQSTVYIELLVKAKNIFINAIPQQNTSMKINQGDEVQFGQAASFVINWNIESNSPEYSLQQYHTFEKLLLLKNVNMFSSLDLYSLADIVRDAEVRIYPKNSFICKQGDASKGAYILHEGSADVIYSHNNTSEVVNKLKDNDVIGELSVIKGGAHSASVKVTSTTALVMLIDRELLGIIIDTKPLVAKALLVRVAGYVKS